MSEHFAALIVVVPLISAFGVALVGWRRPGACFFLAAAALGVATACAVGLLRVVLRTGEVVYALGGWQPPIGIGYRVDALNGVMLVMVTVVALVSIIATRRSVAEAYGDRLGPFYTLYVLFVVGLIGIVVTGDAFNLFVLLEITALTGYALIGLGSGHAPLASLNYIFMGTIGASFYLLGVGYLYLITGTLNMADIASRLPALADSRVLVAAFFIILVGLFMKMALFPLHGWLPNAYDHAPTPASTLIAPLTTKVMIYVMVRVVLSVFGVEFSFDRMAVAPVMVWVAVGAMVMGSFLALGQNQLRRMAAYLVVAEVGYMVGGFWLGNRLGMTGALLHIVNDAAMTLCIFLAAASLYYRFKSNRFDTLRGAFKTMPFTMSALVVGGLSMIGVPPTCGFFSKWYLITGGLAAGHYPFVVALLFSSLVNAVLFFRVFEIAHFEPFENHGHDHDHDPSHVSGHGPTPIREAPADMVVCLLLVALGLVVLGLYAGDIAGILGRVIPPTIT